MLLRFLISCYLAGHCLLASAAPDLLTVPQLQEDLRFVQQALSDIHPDPSFSVTSAVLERAWKDVAAQLDRPMTRDQAWRVFATLNPHFADGHLQVFMRDTDAIARTHLAAGGKLFPFETHIDAQGAIMIRSELGGMSSPLAGRRILSINGVPASQVSAALLARASGDTPIFRAHQAARRMWLGYLKLYGAPETFTLQLERAAGVPQRVQVAASSALPASTIDDFASTFRFELLPGKAALLTVNAFSAPDKKLFYAFTEQAFKAMRDAGTTTLIIDVRQNGGGDDDMWKEGILPYFANKPYRHTSTYVKKVIPGRESASEPLGAVIQGEQKNWEQPRSGEALHFGGNVYVLIGRGTYSSAVLFANVIQDYGFGKLVGEEGSARARQSGGIQQKTLPHSGLGMVMPRFILQPPGGAREQALLLPDIVLADDPIERRALIELLRKRL